MICTKDGDILYLVIRGHKSFVDNYFYLYRTDQVTSVDWFEQDLYLNDSIAGLKEAEPFTSKENLLRQIKNAQRK